MQSLAQAQEYNRQLAESKANQAKEIAGIQSTPIPLEFQQGRGQIATQQYLSQQEALAGAYQEAANLAGLSTAQQQAEQAGLGAAAGLTAPQAANALGTYNPVTGTYGQYGGGTGGGAFNAGTVQGNVNLGAQYSSLNANNVAAKGYEDTIKNYLTQNPDLNPSEFAVVNGVIQWGANQMGNPKYQTLANYINEYANTLAPILGSGGTMTDFKTSLAQSLINGRASGQSISEVLDNISKAADDKLANIRSAATGGGQVAGGTSGYNPTDTGGLTFGSFF